MTNDTQVQSSESGQLKLVGKLLGYSLVSTTLGKGRALYERGKASNSYVARTLDLVEQSVSVAVTAASPYVNKYDAQIRKLDEVACEKLEVIEKQVPEWKAKMNADEARELSKRVLEGGRNSAYQVYDAKLKPRVDSARHMVDAKYTNLLGTLDTYVDYWLPDVEIKADGDANGNANDVAQPKERSVRALTGKVTTRVGRLATRQLTTVRSRSLESLERARATGQYLVGGARTAYDDFVRAVRVEVDSEKSRTETSSSGEQAELTTNPSTSYGELQRRLHDSVVLGRAFTKVGTRYTVSLLNDATHHPYYNDLTTLANNAAKLLPVHIPQIRVAVRVEDAPTSANSQPTASNSTSDSSANNEHAETHRQPTSGTPSPGQD